MSVNILLVNPNTLGSYRKSKTATINLGIAMLSSFLTKRIKCNVKIIDGRYEGLTPEQAYHKAVTHNPNIIGVSLLVESSVSWTNAFLELFQKGRKNVHITVGSYFPSLFPEKALNVLNGVDSVVIGEGEETLLELVNHVKEKQNWKTINGLAFKDEYNRVIVNEKRKLIDNLDDLPNAHRYLVETDGADSEAMIEGTRGCKFHCAFCAVRPFYGLSTGASLRMRSASSIVSEIKFLTQRFPKLKNFRFVDPDFLAPHTQFRAIEFVNLMKQENLQIDLMMDTRTPSIIQNESLLDGMRESGVKRFYLGIESGSPRILKKMHKAINVEDNEIATKILKKKGIDYSYGFMMITPWSEEADIENNINLLKRVGRIEFRSLFHELTLVPNTKAFESAQDSTPLTWSGDLFYYTYKTSSNQIEHLRALSRQMIQIDDITFGFLPDFLYESMRQERRCGDKAKAEAIEPLIDSCFIELFDHLWNHAKTECFFENDSFFLKEMASLFRRKMEGLLKQINAEMHPEQTKYTFPKYAPIQYI